MNRKETLEAKNTSLSENFTLYEMIASSSHPELVTYPKENVILALKDFCEKYLQPLRDVFGPIRINSGYRGKKLNQAVGGVSNSVHRIFLDNGQRIGVAADIVPLKADLVDVYEYIARNVPGIKTVILYRKPNVTKTPFIHIDTRVNREGRAFLEKIGSNNYINYTFRGEK